MHMNIMIMLRCELVYKWDNNEPVFQRNAIKFLF